ncbi:saccharopine dehydrogenase NADP-binding domain-containing protein [Pseudodesulfovibrio piezophilus]|uniref:Saccharopine dehydrogenase NADP binding domain-containing protein n=1 Tax=Pseudodesulfovibrio piezophilus (strain DSM 21447 / JCM 15486 / C1TLV30) TaxID=1322246 RepID=M1WJT8_PSEP2|nr:saccharopine dehydrogenase NADP-binding domain-containing protein [Pseudodesulfovibrio piezophilus]CCH48471.1 protein of unknown function [Pseudodesulfovibrio piezophilus C1TLV30]
MMNREKRKVAVLGGSGDIGQVVCEELEKFGDISIVLGGRSLGRLQDSASRLSGAEVRQCDVVSGAVGQFDDCEIIMNCTGPSCETGPAVAKIALESGAHYVDVGGYALLRESLQQHDEQVRNLRRSHVLSAGWMPGLSEVFVRYALEQAEARQGKARDVTLYCGARDTWSLASARDMVWHIFSDMKFGWFDQGIWQGRSMFRVNSSVDMPQLPDSRQVASWIFNAPSAPLAVERPDVRFRTGLVLVGPYTRLSLVFVKVFMRGWRKQAARLLRAGINKDAQQKGPIGILRAVVTAESGESFVLSLSESRNHWITGLVAAHTAHFILSGDARPGVHYLGEAVNAKSFLDSLQKGGVQLEEVA